MGELLIGFFKFYLEKYNAKQHAISTSHINGPLIDREHYKKELLDLYHDSPRIREEILTKFDKSGLILVEPFDKTVNPGRAVKFSSVETNSFY